MSGCDAAVYFLLGIIWEKIKKYTTFVMRYLEEYNSTEIGKIFHITPATARSW